MSTSDTEQNQISPKSIRAPDLEDTSVAVEAALIDAVDKASSITIKQHLICGVLSIVIAGLIVGFGYTMALYVIPFTLFTFEDLPEVLEYPRKFTYLPLFFGIILGIVTGMVYIPVRILRGVNAWLGITCIILAVAMIGYWILRFQGLAVRDLVILLNAIMISLWFTCMLNALASRWMLGLFFSMVLSPLLLLMLHIFGVQYLNYIHFTGQLLIDIPDFTDSSLAMIPRDIAIWFPIWFALFISECIQRYPTWRKQRQFHLPDKRA